jgi:hypothetical protein
VRFSDSPKSIGSSGWVRSNAWTWVFSSIDNTTRPPASRHENRDHLAVEERPGRLAMQQQVRVHGIARPKVDVVDPQPLVAGQVLDVRRRMIPARQTAEAIVRSAQRLDHGVLPSLDDIFGALGPIGPARTRRVSQRPTDRPVGAENLIHMP